MFDDRRRTHNTIYNKLIYEVLFGREMAAKEDVPPDKLEKKTCCKKIFIGNSLVICPDQEDVKLTSKLTTNEDLLTDNARFLIVLIKSKKQEEAKQDILNEITNESLNDQNKTIHEEKIETEVLKIENTILKQLNTELTDKILLLKELLVIEKSKNNKSSVSNTISKQM